ncbi:maleate cis-trans isomerase family protein [Microvirga massiliensis]|uniref:maleate cis-trans isomerase family protein n=1 Tax=Microvirga massiliensis TaxID=1033741 RepID=UPI00062BB1AA|nr:aspartate/glutamate racemase family protein [Microvirga massiliensis]
MTVSETRRGDTARAIRIGLLVPSSNTVMENDLHKGLPKERYTVHTARMYLEETTRAGEIEMIEEHAPKAAADVGTAGLDLLVFGCTSGGSLFGLDYDRKVCRDLGILARCPTLGTISAVNEALDARGFKRLAVITPYIDDLTEAVARAAENNGRKVVAAHGMGIDVNVELATPGPAEIVAFATDRLRGMEMDGVFVSCTNFRALDALAELEAALGVRVVTSNSAVLEGIRKKFD